MFKDFGGVSQGKIHNLSLKSWSSICLPRSYGGLGLRRMKVMNQALIAKLGWKFLTNQDSLWVQQFRIKYIRYGISSQLLILQLPLRFGRVYFNVSLSFTKISVCEPLNSQTNPSGPPHGYLHFLFFDPSQDIQITVSTPLLISDLIQPNPLQWKSSLIFSLFDTPSAQAILDLKIHETQTQVYLDTVYFREIYHNSAYLAIIGTSPLNLSHQHSTVWKALWKLQLNDRLQLFSGK
ncbi:hypothetical protein SLA2020_402360 [Shorea laevis]